MNAVRSNSGTPRACALNGALLRRRDCMVRLRSPSDSKLAPGPMRRQNTLFNDDMYTYAENAFIYVISGTGKGDAISLSVNRLT